MKLRDFAGRETHLLNYSDAAPVVKEAIGSSSEELYVYAFASSGDVLPAFRNCVRGGATTVMVFQGAGSSASGTIADLFWLGEPLANALGQAAFRHALIHDHLHFVKFGRMLQQSIPRSLPFGDPDLRRHAVTHAREVRRRRFGDQGAGSDIPGCGAGICAL